MNKDFTECNPSPTKKIRIVLADDHPLIREALRSHILKQADFEILGEASDGEEAVELVMRLQPDVVILDISMPKVNGIEATKIIKTKLPKTAVLALTVYSDYERIMGILEAGASGYLTKAALGDEVVQAIRTVVSGETVLAPSVSQEIIKHSIRSNSSSQTAGSVNGITSREREILKYAAEGLNNKEIAAKLNLSVPTIKGYFVEIFEKLNVKSRTEAVMASVRSGLISIEK